MNKHHLIWNESLHQVGITVIDNQHREIVERVNLIADTVDQGSRHDVVQEMMDDLVLFAYEHFALEERLMTEYGFPGMEEHIAEHLDLLQKMDNLRNALRTPNPAKAALVLAFLTDWAELHILQSDREIGEFLADKGMR
ncbi:MAG: hemerythrin family protein [Gammaproteobacteria bacterium]|nr:hemerythrin family protein [Gammaproteobacteria bacterium]MBU1978544.1 hemerythrin family protein [Gammaproteobacteria bacterium]